jgi:hypothetical protein
MTPAYAETPEGTRAQAAPAAIGQSLGNGMDRAPSGAVAGSSLHPATVDDEAWSHAILLGSAAFGRRLAPESSRHADQPAPPSPGRRRKGRMSVTACRMLSAGPFCCHIGLAVGLTASVPPLDDAEGFVRRAQGPSQPYSEPVCMYTGRGRADSYPDRDDSGGVRVDRPPDPADSRGVHADRAPGSCGQCPGTACHSG